MTAIPTITLAGKEYPVPALVPKQIKYVVPALLKAMPAILGCSADLRERKPVQLTSENFDQLIQVIYWGAIWPNDPNRKDPSKSIKFQEVEEMAISLDDMMAAARIVQAQTGLFRPASSVEGDIPGEAQPTG